METKILKGQNKKDFIEKRKRLIEKALVFPKGDDLQHQVRSVVKQIDKDTLAVFYKPGKEAFRKTPNPNDMLPMVLHQGQDITPKWAFEQMWEYLLKIFIIQGEAFKKVLVLLYRLCYMIDYEGDAYAPSGPILEEINKLQHYVLNPGFKEKFGEEPLPLLYFLYFVDLLAWNEDVKYQSVEMFKKQQKGRVNTILSILSAPLLISKFIQNIIANYATGKIDVHLITTTIQKFSKTRGLCVLPQKVLLKELFPYLSEE